jgi:hypothetical protein
MNFISERIKIVGAGFRSIPDLAIGMNHLGGTSYQIRMIIYILCQNLSIDGLTEELTVDLAFLPFFVPDLRKSLSEPS